MTFMPAGLAVATGKNLNDGSGPEIQRIQWKIVLKKKKNQVERHLKLVIKMSLKQRCLF